MNHLNMIIDMAVYLRMLKTISDGWAYIIRFKRTKSIAEGNY